MIRYRFFFLRRYAVVNRRGQQYRRCYLRVMYGNIEAAVLEYTFESVL